MKNAPKQIITYGSSESNLANNTLSSKSSYMCANADITRGATNAPITLEECYERFPNIKEIGNILGVCAANPWRGPKGISGPSLGDYYDLLSGITSEECAEIANSNGLFGPDWLGCLWGSPMTPFSCKCPDVGLFFPEYLRLRLNVATFWNTPVETPPKRQEFLDAIQYGPTVIFTIAGDFNLKMGDIVELKVDDMASYNSPYIPSILSKKYYVIGLKNTIISNGVHETEVKAVEIITGDTSYDRGPEIEIPQYKEPEGCSGPTEPAEPDIETETPDEPVSF